MRGSEDSNTTPTRHALVGNMPVLVIKRKALTRVLLTLHFDGVRVVIPRYSFATGRVQRKRVPDPVRNILAGRNFPSLDLEPIAVLLINDLVMEVKERPDLVSTLAANRFDTWLYVQRFSG